ncbi:MAG: YcdB/YcdC domain-containing protein, partial [Syntrophomonas sp.]
QDWQNRDIRIWNLQWSSHSSASSPSISLYARVNALTGELVAFNLDIPRTDDQKPTLSRETALKTAEDFIKKVYPQRFGQIKLNDTDINSAGNESQTNWNFNYQRVVNGINCPGNGIDINVDSVHKRVTSFNLNWSNQEFPAATNVLGLDKANQLFLQGLPLTLTYIPVNGPQGPVEIRLVYQPQNPPGQPQGVMINAQTGDWLDNEGKPVSEQVLGYHFNDITGHFAEKEITLLGQAGIFGEYGDAFHPNENISLVSLLRAMLSVRDGTYYPREQTDQEIMNRAKVLGWLQKDYSPSSSVDREMMARLITHYLDLDYLVRVPQLFQITFKDSAAMSSEFKGYAALTWGLGIIKGDGVSFVPTHTVTRAEAAAALVRTLKAKSQP